MTWFRAEAGRVDKDAFFSVTPTEGIVDVVISTRGGRPTCAPWMYRGHPLDSSYPGHCSNFTWRFTAEALNTSGYSGCVYFIYRNFFWGANPANDFGLLPSIYNLKGR